MTAARDDPSQVTSPCGVNWSLKAWKQSTRLTMVKHESEFKNQVSVDTDEPVAAETMSQSMANGDQVLSAAEILVSMSSDYSSPLVWFSNIVTYVKHDDDLVFFQKGGQVARKPDASDLAYRQQKTQQMQMRSQHGNRVNMMKRKRAHVETRKCIVDWGMIKKGIRSKRVRDRNPMSTFIRGGFLCRWR